MMFDFQPYRAEAIAWAKDRLGRYWRRRLRHDYVLPHGYEQFNDHPFGYATWNARFQLARYLIRSGLEG